MRHLRKGRAICVNSPVGESECNGRAGNAVRRVEVTFRILRPELERRIGHKISHELPTLSWLTRWTGDVLTRFTIGQGGRTAWERRRGVISTKGTVPFGDQVSYLHLKAAEVHKHKGEPRMSEGAWPGTTAIFASSMR